MPPTCTIALLELLLLKQNVLLHLNGKEEEVSFMLVQTKAPPNVSPLRSVSPSAPPLSPLGGLVSLWDCIYIGRCMFHAVSCMPPSLPSPLLLPPPSLWGRIS